MDTTLTLQSAYQDAERELIRRVAMGEESALAALYMQYGRRLFAHAWRVTGSQTVAEEVLQDSLLAVWQGASHFRGEARLLTWLLAIVHRQALNAVRRKRLPAASPEELAWVVDEAEELDERLALAEQRRALAAALAALSPEHRVALELVFYQGLSLAEVAQVCDCPVGTVKSRLSYAKAHLRRLLGQAGFEVEDLR